MKAPDKYLDGSLGGGGGQILRSSLSLSAITGSSFQLDNIRAGRKRPGLMRQHLTCVKAVAEICRASISEVSVGSGSLKFDPGKIRGGNYDFAIGTAGSTSLVLQTILPVLLYADDETEVRIHGGTHAVKAPCFEYLDEIFIPAIRRMGAVVEISLIKHGFYPAGGGEVSMKVTPSKLSPVSIHEKHLETSVIAEVINTPDIPDSVTEKEIRRVDRKIPLESSTVTNIGQCLSPGNVLLLRSTGTLVHACGERNKRSEQVAIETVCEMQRYLNSPAPVDEYLADQLLLPLALARHGGYTATALTLHFESNVHVIESFLPVKFITDKLDRFSYEVTVTPTTQQN